MHEFCQQMTNNKKEVWFDNKSDVTYSFMIEEPVVSDTEITNCQDIPQTIIAWIHVILWAKQLVDY